MIFAPLLGLTLPWIVPSGNLAVAPPIALAIELSARVDSTKDPRPSQVWGRTKSLEIGAPTTFVVNKSASCGGLGIQFGGAFSSTAQMAWRVTVTPVRVSSLDGVTFRLVWARAISEGRPSDAVKGDMELTLRPAQSVALDMAPWAPDPDCGMSSTKIEVGVQPPAPELDRQLAGTDLWLIDKAPDGTTRSQHLALRGQFGRTQTFFFDDIPGADRSLDLFGDVLAVVSGDGVDVEVNTKRRRTWYEGSASDRAVATSRLHLRADDTAAVELPKGIGPNDPFAGHELSLRVQCRELRPAIGRQPLSVFTAPR